MNSQPKWITQPLSPYDLAAINQGGCESGAYMPAVTYHQAKETMSEHGDDVLDFIEQSWGELPEVPKGTSWSGITVFYLSMAVEAFCRQYEHLEDWDNDNNIEDWD